MNERIKELYNQSFEKKYRVTVLNPEKFAELLIQECAEQVKNLRVNDYGISGAEIIKEHFGVEQ